MEESNPNHKHIGLSSEEIREICKGEAHADPTEQFLCETEEEIRQGFIFFKKHPKTVTILGSARTKEGDQYYELARQVAGRLASELDLAVMTGGGPGIMEAGNRGAKEAGGASIAMTIELPHEQYTNIYADEVMHFHFFFTRKVMMTYGVEAFIYFPGGFGTLNEFFEILTLVQTGKTEPRPIILMGEEFWRPLQQYIEEYLGTRELIDISDAKILYTITDSPDEVVSIMKAFYRSE